MKQEVVYATLALTELRDLIREHDDRQTEVTLKVDVNLANAIDLVLEQLREFADRELAMRRAAAVGGRVRTEAKARASAENGKKGGRPRKVSPSV